MVLRAPGRRREPRRALSPLPARVTREELSAGAAFAPRDFGRDPAGLPALPGSLASAPLGTLRSGILTGHLGGPWLDGFPRYVWHRSGDIVVEFRLTGRRPGEYSGYELHPSEWPEGLADHAS
ncbi:hypothetical protein GO001_18155 [Streptomyces sp. NRRL B-1677]|uniref:Uncharacterized protein n=1 Tax=Streptomyces klenkii TaxID=1420899 RepID=A0A3B0B250_9ACTN|nr:MULTISPECIES: hypothetical protein [Streptomyces]MBF6047137.1 hypothetical protein [Streptomyces sp. NRRL B-1677]RKN65826.1 hypothetical protein D7231_23680 [Streptomyces klenkii]